MFADDLADNLQLIWAGGMTTKIKHNDLVFMQTLGTSGTNVLRRGS